MGKATVASAQAKLVANEVNSCVATTKPDDVSEASDIAGDAHAVGEKHVKSSNSSQAEVRTNFETRHAFHVDNDPHTETTSELGQPAESTVSSSGRHAQHVDDMFRSKQSLGHTDVSSGPLTFVHYFLRWLWKLLLNWFAKVKSS